MRGGAPKDLVAAVLAGLCYLASEGVGQGQEVVAVLSSRLGPYLEAFDGFQQAFGRPVRSIELREDNLEMHDETRVVVAFGGKAALSNYPDHVVLIYCMAPGTRMAPGRRPGSVVEIRMLPRAGSVFSKFRQIQPSLQRIALLWSAPSMEEYLPQVWEAARIAGVEVRSERLEVPADLPDRVRALYGNVDAIWLLPDPILVNEQSFSILKEFSWANRVPFYAPTAGLVDRGATASVSTSFREIGREAARAVRDVLRGNPVPGTVYPREVEVTLHAKAAEVFSLRVPEGARRRPGGGPP